MGTSYHHVVWEGTLVIKVEIMAERFTASECHVGIKKQSYTNELEIDNYERWIS